METITRQESIDGCMKQWEFYAETGTDDKTDYAPALDIRTNCFFCHYVGCACCGEKCPGWRYWASGEGHCMDALSNKDKQTSLYKHWERARSKKKRKLWASRIVWMIWQIGQDDLTGSA